MIPAVSNGVKELLTRAGFKMIVDWLVDLGKYDGKPKHLADSAAPKDMVYYSTTVSKLVYKDSAGAVHDLY